MRLKWCLSSAVTIKLWNGLEKQIECAMQVLFFLSLYHTNPWYDPVCRINITRDLSRAFWIKTIVFRWHYGDDTQVNLTVSDGQPSKFEGRSIIKLEAFWPNLTRKKGFSKFTYLKSSKQAHCYVILATRENISPRPIL